MFCFYLLHVHRIGNLAWLYIHECSTTGTKVVLNCVFQIVLSYSHIKSFSVYLRYLHGSHSRKFDLYSLVSFDVDDSTGWMFTAFLLLLFMKFFLFVIVTQQFYCTQGKEHRGKCDCLCRLCCTNEIIALPCVADSRLKDDDLSENSSDDSSEEYNTDVTLHVHTRTSHMKNVPRYSKSHTEHPTAAGLDLMTKRTVNRRRKSFRRSTTQIHSQSRRAVVLQQLWREADVWRSDLRARDIQLMLRMSRVMPSKKALSKAKEDDVMRTEVATYLLGTGGVVDIKLGEDLHQLSLERQRSIESTDSSSNDKKEATEKKDVQVGGGFRGSGLELVETTFEGGEKKDGAKSAKLDMKVEKEEKKKEKKKEKKEEKKEETEKEQFRRETAFAISRKSLTRKTSSFHMSRSHPIMKKQIIQYKRSASNMGRLPSMRALIHLSKGMEEAKIIDHLYSVEEVEEDILIADDEVLF